jgi:hypothetical protein
MAAPNIVNVATITGKTIGAAVGITATDIVSNTASSGKVFKINTLTIANVDGVSAADITVQVVKTFSGTPSTYRIVNTVSVPADATLVAIAKDTSIYLEEDDKIQALASAAGDLEVVCSYEEIS